jgi:precorrin-8X/cobalt-precorrin-8 methylmutase
MREHWNLPPDEIERRSLGTIDTEAESHDWPMPEWRIVRRMVYTTADFEFIKTARIHEKATKSGMAALKSGAVVFTDTRMAMAGIGDRFLEPFGARKECFMHLPEVADLAKQLGSSRGYAAIDKSLEVAAEGGIYVIGNAPTALLRLVEHIRAGKAKPALVVGLPVGFVNADLSHDELAGLDVPYVTVHGRKGGSALAASVVNEIGRILLEEEA